MYNAIYTPCVEDQPDCILHQAVSGVPNPLKLIAWPINVGMWMSKNSNKIQKTPSYPTSAQPVLPTSFHRKLAGSLTASGLVARGTFIPDVRPNFRKSFRMGRFRWFLWSHREISPQLPQLPALLHSRRLRHFLAWLHLPGMAIWQPWQPG